MVDNLDLGRYLAGHPNVSRLRLVGVVLAALVVLLRWSYALGRHSTFLAHRYLACVQVHARTGHHSTTTGRLGIHFLSLASRQSVCYGHGELFL